MSTTTIRTAEDDQGNYDLVIPIRPYENTTVLKNRLYASMSASTNRYPEDEHKVSVEIGDDGDINLHFHCVYLCMSLADWDRVVNLVAQARSAATESGSSEPASDDKLPLGIVAARAQRAAGINR